LPKFDEEEEIEHLFTKLTSTEKKVIEILRLNPKIKQPELAKILKVTQQAVSKIFVSLRNKYKE
jgi:DNA-binding MarR family transcriptional regulator